MTEADLHGLRSRITRRKNYSTQDLLEKLYIPGYSITLPDSWKLHDQARLIVYVSDEIKAVVRGVARLFSEGVTGKKFLPKEKNLSVLPNVLPDLPKNDKCSPRFAKK